ncbi:unnamed protein product [Caenorhabditis auriculariae]|uniref:Uncharacterized protein n=1 Tax=Caenorhabditis auriculariae TaxID=2777116 RepID=A0A8S1H0Z8_9PELO|nr:unnamed protein product [Caenorhabditis auriculariae]
MTNGINLPVATLPSNLRLTPGIRLGEYVLHNQKRYLSFVNSTYSFGISFASLVRQDFLDIVYIEPEHSTKQINHLDSFCFKPRDACNVRTFGAAVLQTAYKQSIFKQPGYFRIRENFWHSEAYKVNHRPLIARFRAKPEDDSMMGVAYYVGAVLTTFAAYFLLEALGYQLYRRRVVAAQQRRMTFSRTTRTHTKRN